MEYTWITGSVAWHYNNLMREMIGIRAEYNGLSIQPAFPKEWNEISATRQFRRKNFSIVIRREDVTEPELFLNEAPYPGHLINMNDCLNNNSVLMIIPKK